MQQERATEKKKRKRNYIEMEGVIQEVTSRQAGRAGLREIVKYTRRVTLRSLVGPLDASDDWIHLSVLRVLREGQTERQAGQDKKEKIYSEDKEKER